VVQHASVKHQLRLSLAHTAADYFSSRYRDKRTAIHLRAHPTSTFPSDGITATLSSLVVRPLPLLSKVEDSHGLRLSKHQRRRWLGQRRLITGNTADRLYLNELWGTVQSTDCRSTRLTATPTPDDDIIYARPENSDDGVFRDPSLIISIDPGSGGTDTIYSSGGNDTVVGGAGDDFRVGRFQATIPSSAITPGSILPPNRRATLRIKARQSMRPSSACRPLTQP